MTVLVLDLKKSPRITTKMQPELSIFVNSELIIKGGIDYVFAFLKKQQYYDLELAKEIILKNGHNIAHFGIGCHFLFSDLILQTA